MEGFSSFNVNLDLVPQEAWTILAQKKILFGHQSVGQNIIEGLVDVLRAHPPACLNIYETSEVESFDKPGFYHMLIGDNRNPKSKIDHFRNVLDRGVGEFIDIALFKLCYVDVDHQVDILALFEYLDDNIQYLSRKYSNTRIIPFTIPVITFPPGLKTSIKRLLGRNSWLHEDNIARNNFNKLIAHKYGYILFDLAASEARKLNGQTASFTLNNRSYLQLNSEYTYDGGHLNKIGRQVVATDLLFSLADVCRR